MKISLIFEKNYAPNIFNIILIDKKIQKVNELSLNILLISFNIPINFRFLKKSKKKKKNKSITNFQIV